MSEAIALAPPIPGSSIYAILPRIIGDISPIKKAHKNESQKFSFRGVDDVYSALNPLLEKHGVSIVPEVIDEQRESYDNKNGTRMFRCVLRVRFHISASDGSEVCAVVSGEAMDSGDKATPKALSMAYKYMAFQVFCIPTGEKIDTEHTNPVVDGPKTAPVKGAVKDDAADLTDARADAFLRMRAELGKGFAGWAEKRAWRTANKAAKDAMTTEMQMQLSQAFIIATPAGVKEAT